MRKMLYLTFLLILLVISGCTPNDIVDIRGSFESHKIYTALFEERTILSRTYIDYVNGEKYLRWTANDEISIFEGSTLNMHYRFSGKTGDNAGNFEKVSSGFGTGNPLDCNYAVYPYNSDTKISENGVISVTLPVEQNYAEKSFGLNANTMVSATRNINDTFLPFKNVGGYLKFKFYGEETIKSIILRGNNGEKLAGLANVTTTYGGLPTMTMASDATETITLNCGVDGVKIGTTKDRATEFWLVVPPVTFTKGFTFTVIDINGSKMTRSVTSPVKIERNVIKSVAVLKVECGIPNNQIWYTSVSNVITYPYHHNFGDAKILSNEMTDDGIGIITFDREVTTIGNEAFGKSSINFTSITLPNSINNIEEYAFKDCKIKSVNIPSNVTSISPHTFHGCKELTSIVLPDKLTEIGVCAFYGCYSLKSIHIPESVSSIGAGAFHGCSKLTTINIPAAITSINVGVFERCKRLASIDIPNSVTVLQDCCFASSGLIHITIPNSVKSIGSSAFECCDNLNSVAISNGVQEIGDRAFFKCISLKSIAIPNGVQKIGAHAFSDCENMESVNIPNSTHEIGSAAFSGCSRLTGIDLPDNLYTISPFMLDWCKSLVSIVIPNSVVTIGTSAFQGCNIASFNIPQNVKSIGDAAFNVCVKEIHCKGVLPPVLTEHTFALNSYSICHIYVPKGCSSAYRTADYWQEFENIIEE